MNGTLPMHRELEEEIAAWMETEDALVFTTGYQANLGCLSGVLGPSDTVIADSSDHASILDGCKLSGARLRPFRHQPAGAAWSRCSSEPPGTAAACWWSWTASTRWRATSATCPPSPSAAARTAPA